MKILALLIIPVSIFVSQGTSRGLKSLVCDADSDCFYAPEDSLRPAYYPALIILTCTGATPKDLDSIADIADSLHWLFATCHKSKNHRSIYLNDNDIMKTYEKLTRDYPTDVAQVYIYGFSGMGVQAMVELFWHPKNFRGVIAVCAHKGAMSFVKWPKLNDKLIYLISRKKDWNLDDNRQMDNQFKLNNISDTLVITPGKHTPPGHQELLDACSWLSDNANQ